MDIIYGFLWAMGFLFDFIIICSIVGIVVDWVESKLKKALKQNDTFMRWLSNDK